MLGEEGIYVGCWGERHCSTRLVPTPTSASAVFCSGAASSLVPNTVPPSPLPPPKKTYRLREAKRASGELLGIMSVGEPD